MCSLIADESCGYISGYLTVFVVGASGDLAKKKTYPSLYDLYRHKFLPLNNKTIICGYARSAKEDDAFRAHLLPYLKGGTDDDKNDFLNMCIYRRGAYDSADDVGKVFEELKLKEDESGCGIVNRLFYFAIPPSVFVPIGKSIKEAVIGPSEANGSAKGWSRLIIEKPFGKDLESFETLGNAMSSLYTEDYIYRIDHYLGKEMVKNLEMLRFGNAIFEPLWNRHYISSVSITFKENFGTKGRGGYFDGYGIIRDIIQNHLLQVLSIVAMEPPVKVAGEGYSNYVRNEKVKVLNCIEPVELEDCVLGQYLAAKDGSEVAYTEDPTVPDDSVTPTFATMLLKIKNPRWDGVPFILKAGKALNERKAEIRIQFRQPPGAAAMFPGSKIPTNELVLRLQPDEAIYMKANVKAPGLSTTPVTSELDLSYKSRFADTVMFDAYTRLILDVLRGSQAAFVRDDELRAAWKIFTPVLHRIEKEKIKPIPYEYGGRGPKESDELLQKAGFSYHGGEYKWQGSSV
uniref:Glucose-6-phosphate 1-dehydrogenase n=1 Tax=Odontella aurita TaxID=265563 RepID=A0A7S4JW14_9STRA|mmetsp:Transcript_54887/g.164323  ORF Transcript_54887/g.164323 Transcript_54887/m.164323 type:complete len:515 (+) Transcript_54887:343-1887(+)